MSTECCICTRPDDLECPSCDKLFCISCFVDHGKSCYEEMKKKAEQKKCSMCGRYASINPTVHCSDCQIEICRSCLYAHRKTHEAEKIYCTSCGDRIKEYSLCGTCNRPVCSGCNEKHQRIHKSYCAQCGNLHYNDILDRCPDCHKLICVLCGPEHKKKHHKKCLGCNGDPAGPFMSCPDCRKELCEACMEVHRKGHEQKKESMCPECGLGFIVSYSGIECPDCHQRFHTGCYYGTHTHKEAKKKTGHKTYRCSGCNRIKTQDPNKSGSPFWQCPQCQEYYCEACTMTHTHVYARANFAGRFNPNDFKINSDIINETIKQAKETAERIRQEAEAKRKQEEEARREQMKHANDAFWQNMFSGRSSFWGKDEPEETDAYKAHYTGQQSQNHSQYSRQQTRTSAPSQELVAAFKLLQLSTRATVQEVKRARNRLAKQGEYRHPDVGGTQEAFVKLNNAYELALSHAERNER